MYYLLILVGTIIGYFLSILPIYVGAIILLGAVIVSLIGIYIELCILERKIKSSFI